MAEATWLNIYILTFNCARNLVDRHSLASHLFDGLANRALPDLIVLSLQEIAPISSSFWGGARLAPYLTQIEDAVRDAVDSLGGAAESYGLVLCRHVGMTGLIILARQPDRIGNVESAGVGLGPCGMGNKGAVGARFMYRAEHTRIPFIFVAAHYAPFEEEVQRRNQDWEDTVRGLGFSSHKAVDIDQAGGSEDEPLLLKATSETTIYGSSSYLFVAGDLNYRTSNTSPADTDYIEAFPQPGEVASSPRHPSNLLRRDQLSQELEASRTLQGLVEAPISFPPTYKYQKKGPFLTSDEGISEWHWATHRWPSWCDRILWLPLPPWLPGTPSERDIIVHKYSALPLFATSDHRAVALHVSVPLLYVPDPPPQYQSSTDVRTEPRLELREDRKARRQSARRLEIMVGAVLYATTTWDGGIATLGTLVGVLGTIVVLKVFTGS